MQCPIDQCEKELKNLAEAEQHRIEEHDEPDTGLFAEERMGEVNSGP